MTDEGIESDDNYILVTPVKDEEKDLPDLIISVNSQLKKPILWVIVNDGSTDKSPQIIKSACKKYNWIKTITLPQRERDIGIGYSFVCRSGFEYIIAYCEKNSISYEYIGLLDADILLESNYFTELIKNFNQDRKLGVASGSTWNFNGSTYIMVQDRPDEPCGAARLWRRKCFEETDGYLLTYAPDTISNIKCRLRGWTTKIFFELELKQSRMTSSAEGLWKGYLKKGEADYFLNMKFLYILLRTISFLSRIRFYIGLAYISGYFKSFINRSDRISDQEIINYNQSKHLKNAINSIIKKEL